MGQQDIYRLLEDNPDRWYTAKEIAEVFDTPTANISKALASLRRSGVVLYQKIRGGKRNRLMFQYKFKPTF